MALAFGQLPSTDLQPLENRENLEVCVRSHFGLLTCLLLKRRERKSYTPRVAGGR
jgi:hypothetical protein